MVLTGDTRPARYRRRGQRWDLCGQQPGALSRLFHMCRLPAGRLRLWAGAQQWGAHAVRRKRRAVLQLRHLHRWEGRRLSLPRRWWRGLSRNAGSTATARDADRDADRGSTRAAVAGRAGMRWSPTDDLAKRVHARRPQSARLGGQVPHRGRRRVRAPLMPGRLRHRLHGVVGTMRANGKLFAAVWAFACSISCELQQKVQRGAGRLRQGRKRVRALTARSRLVATGWSSMQY